MNLRALSLCGVTYHRKTSSSRSGSPVASLGHFLKFFKNGLARLMAESSFRKCKRNEFEIWPWVPFYKSDPVWTTKESACCKEQRQRDVLEIRWNHNEADLLTERRWPYWQSSVVSLNLFPSAAIIIMLFLLIVNPFPPITLLQHNSLSIHHRLDALPDLHDIFRVPNLLRYRLIA